MLTKTILHEQTAHALKSLKGLAQSDEQTLIDHDDYNKQKTITSPEEVDIETDPKFRGTPAKKASDEVDGTIDKMRTIIKNKK